MINPEARLHTDAERNHEKAPEVPLLFDVQEFMERRQSLTEYVLTKGIELPRQPFEYNDISPTPLDPYGLVAKGFRYFDAAITFMNLDVTYKALDAGLPLEYVAVIAGEVDDQHLHRSQKNDEARMRLIENMPEIRSHYEAERTLRVLAGVGAVHEPALLLAKVPQMEGIEAAKATRLMSPNAIKRAEVQFEGGLVHAEHSDSHIKIDRMFNISNAEKISLRSVRKNEARDDAAPYVPTLKDSIAILKWVQAELTVDGVPLEVVSRNSYIFLPPDLPLKGVPQDLITLPNKTKVNRQQIDVTKYYRIKKDD